MKHRIFTAIQLSQTVRSGLEDLLAPFHQRTGALLRWLPVENWHVTLNFLGAHSDDDLPAIEKIIREVVADHQYFNLYFDDLQFFPPRGPRKVVLTMVKNRNLFNLQYALRLALEKYLPAGRQLPFIPHISLANLHTRDLAGITHAMAQTEFKKRLEVTEVALLESRVVPPQGTRFVPLFEQSLKRETAVDDEE